MGLPMLHGWRAYTVRLLQGHLFVLRTTLGTRCVAVLVQEPPNPLHPIRFHRGLQLAAFVRPDVPRKFFVWPVEWHTFAYARKLRFLSHGPRLATTGSGGTPPSFLPSASLARRRGLQFLK